MDPPGHATDIVSRQVTKNRPKGPLISHVSKFGGKKRWPEADQPDLALGPLVSVDAP